MTVQVTAANCDCNLLTWTNPATATDTINVGDSSKTMTIPLATVNEASKTTSQEIKSCYPNSACAETATWSLVLLEGDAALSTTGFITAAGDSKTMTVHPTAPAHIGTWSIKATQATASGADPVYTAFIITVGCTITAVASPSPPAQ